MRLSSIARILFSAVFVFLPFPVFLKAGILQVTNGLPRMASAGSYLK